MTDTVLSSANAEVTIGFGRPFVIIGERINPTGRKILAEEMKNGDYSRVESDARAQMAAGADMLDVNAGIPLADEPRILAESIRLVQSITDAPLSIDSSVVAALEAGLEAYEGKPLLNSVTGEEERLEAVLPLVKNTARPWSRFPTTKPAFRKIRTSALWSRKKSWSAPPITAFIIRMWWWIRWSCRSAR